MDSQYLEPFNFVENSDPFELVNELWDSVPLLDPVANLGESSLAASSSAYSGMESLPSLTVTVESNKRKFIDLSASGSDDDGEGTIAPQDLAFCANVLNLPNDDAPRTPVKRHKIPIESLSNSPLESVNNPVRIDLSQEIDRVKLMGEDHIRQYLKLDRKRFGCVLQSRNSSSSKKDDYQKAVSESDTAAADSIAATLDPIHHQFWNIDKLWDVVPAAARTPEGKVPSQVTDAIMTLALMGRLERTRFAQEVLSFEGFQGQQVLTVDSQTNSILNHWAIHGTNGEAAPQPVRIQQAMHSRNKPDVMLVVGANHSEGCQPLNLDTFRRRFLGKSKRLLVTFSDFYMARHYQQELAVLGLDCDLHQLFAEPKGPEADKLKMLQYLLISKARAAH